MKYRIKSASDRERMLAELGRGNHEVIGPLADYDEETGHPQAADTRKLVDYVHTDRETHSEVDDEHDSNRIHHHFSDKPEDRASDRARSAHAHLTDKPIDKGDLVGGTFNYSSGTVQRTGSGKVTSNNPRTTGGRTFEISQPKDSRNQSGTMLGYSDIDNLSHHATHYLNQRKKEEQTKHLGGYRKKSAAADRERILSSLGQGDHTAIHALHDWHQDNPGHEQERDVAELRDYVTSPWHSGRLHTAQDRSRSAHAHLIGRNSYQDGDLVSTIHNDGDDNHRLSYGYHHGDSDDEGFGTVRFPHPSGKHENYTAHESNLLHHATDWLNRRKQSQSKSLNQLWKSLIG